MEPFVGEIRLFPYNFVPKGWLPCDGRLLSTQTNAALFSLLGTQFGSSGNNLFALPDLRGRTALARNSTGTPDPGLSNHTQGQSAGTEKETLPAAALAQHTHEVYVSDALGNSGPAGAFPATSANLATPPVASRSTYVKFDSSKQQALNPATIQPTPPQQPLDNMQPSLVLQYCIASVGVYPPHP